MAYRVGVIIFLSAMLAFSSIGVAAADYHTTDDYNDDDWSGDSDWEGDSDWSGDSDWDGDGSTDSTDASDGGYDTNPTSTFSGVAIPIPNVIRAEYSDAIEEAKSSYPGEAPELWLFMNQDTTAIVASNTAIEMSEVEVEGYRSNAGAISVIVAESVTTDTSPRSIDSTSLANTPANYEFQYVESSGAVKHVPFAFETADRTLVQEATTGAFASRTLTAGTGRLLPPSELANQVAVNASRILNGGAKGYELGEYRTSGSIMLDSRRQDTWIVNSDAKVTGVVLNRPVGAPGDAAADDIHWFYARNVTANSESEQEFARVVDRSENEAGFTVTTEVNLIGSSISSKESLVAASACDGSETVGAAPNCVPAVTDMTILTGIAAASGDEYQALPFIAANNEIQSSIVHAMSGRFRVTGEVMDSQNVHPGFSGRIFVLYEMERIGEVNLAGEVMASAERDKTTMVDGIREQLRTSPSEYESYAQSKEQQNPVSSDSEGETKTEDGGTEQRGIGEVTADGAGFSAIGGLFAVLVPYLIIRRQVR